MTTSFVYKQKYVRFCIKLYYKNVKQYIPQLLFVDFLAHLKTVKYQW